MRFFAFIVLITPAAAMAADIPAVKGVYTDDLNRGPDPCADLYEFANGSWCAR